MFISKKGLTKNDDVFDKNSELEDSFDFEENQSEEKNRDWLETEAQLAIDVYQTPNEIIIKSAVAGVKSEDINISITGDMITIEGKRDLDDKIQEKDYFKKQCYWGRFSQSYVFPVDIDPEKANATLKNGILTIKLMKVDKEKTKIIKVKGD
jgi:HSP20 family protein